MDKKFYEGFNEYLIFEFVVLYYYLVFVIWFELNDLLGFGIWFCQQFQDEFFYVYCIIDYFFEWDQKVVFLVIVQLESDWENVQVVVDIVFELEQCVICLIEKLYDLVEKFGDCGLIFLLQWFIQEQMEEENVVWVFIGCLKFVGDSGFGLLFVDQEFFKGVVFGVMEELEV